MADYKIVETCETYLKTLCCILCFFSWFRHFYIFASLCTTLSLILTSGMYIWSWELPHWFVMLLDLLGSSNRKAHGKGFCLFVVFCINCVNINRCAQLAGLQYTVLVGTLRLINQVNSNLLNEQVTLLCKQCDNTVRFFMCKQQGAYSVTAGKFDKFLHFLQVFAV